jgi:hypothetical protein
MKREFLGFFKEAGPTITVGFYDPEVYQPDADGRYPWPFGGAPHFFSITIDPVEWKVIGHYFSRL